MTKNMGGADRIIRLAIAAVLIVLYATHVVTGTGGIVALVVAGIFILTSLVSFCPVYTLLGFKTCKTTG